MGTNTRPMKARGTLIMEAADGNSYRAVTLSSISITGTSLTATVVAQDTGFTDANFAEAIKKLFGV